MACRREEPSLARACLLPCLQPSAGQRPHFDFDATIAPVPIAIRGDLARWVEDNVDALVRAFASDDDGVIVAADEGGVVDEPGVDGGDGGGGDDVSDASDAFGGAPENAVSDMSD